MPGPRLGTRLVTRRVESHEFAVNAALPELLSTRQRELAQLIESARGLPGAEVERVDAAFLPSATMAAAKAEVMSGAILVARLPELAIGTVYQREVRVREPDRRGVAWLPGFPTV